jgi:endonuclease IV
MSFGPYKGPLAEPGIPPDSRNMELLRAYGIGAHVQKQRTLPATIRTIVVNGMEAVPVQIFLSGRLSLMPRNDLFSEGELSATRELIDASNVRLFIHAPYTVNLADGGIALEANVQCLQKQLEVGSAIGAKGVVVHVGKHCHRSLPGEAREQMRRTIEEIVRPGYACPLLLETPAGQGTELLTTPEDFMGFCRDLSLGMCIDTCHVFACGACPMQYLDSVLATCPELLKLIHFNDSMARRGSRTDRHAFVGTGEIGLERLIEVAHRASEYRIPMLTE